MGLVSGVEVCRGGDGMGSAESAGAPLVAVSTGAPVDRISSGTVWPSPCPFFGIWDDVWVISFVSTDMTVVVSVRIS